jgi:hypothetical protein
MNILSSTETVIPERVTLERELQQEGVPSYVIGVLLCALFVLPLLVHVLASVRII